MAKLHAYTPTETDAQTISRFTARISRPQPKDFGYQSQFQFGWKKSIVSDKALIVGLDDKDDIRVHPITKVIFKTQGASMSTTDKEALKAEWVDAYQNYQLPDGTYPYPTVDDLIQACVNVWTEIQGIYTDSTTRSNVASKITNNDRVLLADILPSWVTTISSTEVFELKFYQHNFNNLAKWHLESSRFPGIGSSIAQDIINERKGNGEFSGPADVSSRVSSVGSTIEQSLTDQVNEGSLTFSDEV